MLGGTFSLAQVLRSTNAVDSKHSSPTNGGPSQAAALLSKDAERGYTLFEQNCAHCHGEDARGDEGPDLHGVTKSDVRITSIIKNGIKGEMPKFGTKLTDADVRALIAFVRSLKD
jgi:mono/diheme cytochrome c family protein